MEPRVQGQEEGVNRGHEYREDGWCKHEQCLRHHMDPPDFCACPDTSGYRFPRRSDSPKDKRATWKRMWGPRLTDILLSFFRS